MAMNSVMDGRPSRSEPNCLRLRSANRVLMIEGTKRRAGIGRHKVRRQSQSRSHKSPPLRAVPNRKLEFGVKELVVSEPRGRVHQQQSCLPLRAMDNRRLGGIVDVPTHSFPESPHIPTRSDL